MGWQWQYKRIPFGTKFELKLFQRYITNLLGDVDDIICRKTIEDYNNRLLQVLKNLISIY